MGNDAVTIRIDLGKYKYVDLPLDAALRLLYMLEERRGSTLDLDEAIRYLENFEEFYGMMKRKFRDYITPPKDQRDLLLGRVVVDKLRLYRDGDENRVVIVFDKRFPVNDIVLCLKELGYGDINIVEEKY